ncbi:T9SS type A sorting domain-containing protein [Flavobacterium enshiense]|uniref:T9SS type A sorting domain-containing protein n=1 Tax=Flavobacterium enshiense TaxID=1341165 RepID=UPI00345D0D88
MKKLYFLILFSTFSLFLYAQSPTIQWQRAYGGSGNDYAQSIKQTPDGGYIFAGSTSSIDGDITNNTGSTNVWVVKTNNAGDILWNKTFGGSSGAWTSNIELTNDGGYIFAGVTNSNDGSFTGNHGGGDVYVVKLDSAGEIIWQNLLGGTNDDYAYNIKQTPDGGYIFVGLSDSNDGNLTENNGGEDYWIVKLNANGTIQWQKSYGGSNIDRAQTVTLTSDNGYIVTGYSQSNDGDVVASYGGPSNDDYWILKLNESGDIQWQKTLGGTGSDSGYETIQTSDGGYIVAGDSESTNGDVTGTHGNSDIWLAKLNASGNIVWQKAYGGSGSEIVSGIKQTSDNGYVVFGRSTLNNGDITNNHGGYDFWVLKITNNGSIQWQKSYGGSLDEYSLGLTPTLDGGYITAGYTYSNNGDISNNHGGTDCWIIKLSPGGNAVPPTPQFANLLGPSSGTVAFDTPFTISGQIFVSGVTDVAPNISGQAPGIQVWVGVSPPGQNIHPMYWSNWVPATHNGAYIGSNDEYNGTIACSVGATYYYATRFLMTDGTYVYGGIDNSGQGNFWDGVTYKSGVLTVTEPQLPGIYNTLVERLNTTGGPYNFTNETITSLGLNEYRTTNVALYYPQGGTPGSTGTIAINAYGNSGYRFKRVGYNIRVEDQMLFEYYGNQINQTPEQFNASTYNPSTGVITIEYNIYFSGNPRQFRNTYTPTTLGNTTANVEHFSYYPNPVKDILNISGIKSDSSYRIYNLIGQCVITGTLKAGQNQIDMTSLEKGNYILKITSDSEIKTIKVIRN